MSIQSDLDEKFDAIEEIAKEKVITSYVCREFGTSMATLMLHRSEKFKFTKKYNKRGLYKWEAKLKQ